MTASRWTPDAVRDLGVVTDLVTAGSVLGLGRTKSFGLARNGEFPVPVLRCGSTYRVPTAPLRRLLELGDLDEPGGDTS
jgi:hypothetical protein